MKKTSKRLALRFESIAVLSHRDLGAVIGGRDDNGTSAIGSCLWTRCLCPTEPATYRCGTGND